MKEKAKEKDKDKKAQQKKKKMSDLERSGQKTGAAVHKQVQQLYGLINQNTNIFPCFSIIF